MTWIEEPFAAVILSGGTGARLGGADKAGLEVEGLTLLERALSAVDRAVQIVVVGPTVAVAASQPITFVREDPPGGGPAAGLLAGRDALTAEVRLMVILAVDMPGVMAATIARLGEALTDASDSVDGAFLAGADGRRQLAGVLRISALDGVRPPADAVDGLPMHRLLDPLRLSLVTAQGTEATDVDTWADLSSFHRSGRPEGLPRIQDEVHAVLVNLHDWIDELCDVLDVETEVDEALILDLARAAAHNVERPAAPITTYLLGYAAGHRGANPEQIERLAGLAQVLAENWDRPAGAPDPNDVAIEVPDDGAVDHTGDRFDL